MSNMSAFHYELSLAESQHDLRSNLLPLGLVKKGAYRHRALLFKVGEEGGERGEGRREGREGDSLQLITLPHCSCRSCVMSWLWAARWCEASTTATGTRWWSWLKTAPHALSPGRTSWTWCTILASSCWRPVPRPTSTPNCEMCVCTHTYIHTYKQWTRGHSEDTDDIHNLGVSMLVYFSISLSIHTDVHATT